MGCTGEPEQVGRASHRPKLERCDLVRVICVAAVDPPLPEAGRAGCYRGWAFVQRMAARSRDVREPVEWAVCHAVTWHMTAVRVVAPISELAISQERIRTTAIAGGVVRRVASGVQICLGHTPAA